MPAYKEYRKSYNLIFSHAKLPEGVTSILEDGEPNEDVADFCTYLRDSPPMISFIFNTTHQKPPSIMSMYGVIQHAYTETANDPPLHDTYGLLLDCLRFVGTKSPATKVPVTDDESPIVELKPNTTMYDALRGGTILQIEDNICSLRVVAITEFVL